MSKYTPIATRIGRMKRGDFFLVSSSNERKDAISAGRHLKHAGVIEFDIKTFSEGTKFKVSAV